jgi:hypothetical protein
MNVSKASILNGFASAWFIAKKAAAQQFCRHPPSGLFIVGSLGRFPMLDGFQKKDGPNLEESRRPVDDERGHHPHLYARGLDGFDKNKFCLFAGARVDVLDTFRLQRLLSQPHQEINSP